MIIGESSCLKSFLSNAPDGASSQSIIPALKTLVRIYVSRVFKQEERTVYV